MVDNASRMSIVLSEWLMYSVSGKEEYAVLSAVFNNEFRLFVICRTNFPEIPFD